MTEILHYHDVFTTILVPETERQLALAAKTLLDTANNVNLADRTMSEHLSKVTNEQSAAQAFWDYENDEIARYDRLVITLIRRGLTIAIEQRLFDDASKGYRQSLILNNTKAKVYNSDLRRNGQMDLGSDSAESIQLFKDRFFYTTAHLGLQCYILQLDHTDQNESSSATFASAA